MAGKPGRVAGKVPVPEGGMDCKMYFSVEAAVWEAEGRSSGPENDPRHFPKVKAKNIMALTTSSSSL